MIYFDNAATTPLSKRVIKEMQDSLDSHYGNPSSIHAAGRQSRSIIEKSRKKIANILEASIGEIYFCSSATEANNLLIGSAVKTHNIKRIISSALEHPCVRKTVKSIKNVELVMLNNTNSGQLDLDQLERLLEQKTPTLVSLMWVNNELGVINPIEKIAALCQSKDHVYLHTDAVQAIGKLPISLKETKIDFLTASGHKFHSMKGAGFFYMNGESIIDPLLLGGAQERNMRAGTENVLGIQSLATALDECITELETRKEKISAIKNYLITKLKEEFEDIKLNAEGTQTVYHIVSVSFPPTEKADLLMFNLDINGICASSGSACSSGIEQDSDTLIAIGHDPKRKTIRFSFSPQNTLAEVDQLLKTLADLTPKRSKK